MQKNCGKSFLKTTEDLKSEKRFCKSFLSRNRKVFKRERFLCAACSFLLIVSAPAVCYKKATTPIFASEYEKDGGVRYDVYLYSPSSGCDVLSFFSIEEVCAGKAENAKNVKGECAFLTRKLTENQIEKWAENIDAEFVFKESGENFGNYYFYSSSLPLFVVINGFRVNIHASVTENGTGLAYPLAFGAY